MSTYLCRDCNTKTEEQQCPDCGKPLGQPLTPSLESEESSAVGDSMERLDEMVAAASMPNLADLFRKGKQAGLIQPAYEYQAPSQSA